MQSKAFEKMLQVTGLTVAEVIEIEKNATSATLSTCNVDYCEEDWHWCTGCDCHLEEDGTCRNCG